MKHSWHPSSAEAFSASSVSWCSPVVSLSGSWKRVSTKMRSHNEQSLWEAENCLSEGLTENRKGVSNSRRFGILRGCRSCEDPRMEVWRAWKCGRHILADSYPALVSHRVAHHTHLASQIRVEHVAYSAPTICLSPSYRESKTLHAAANRRQRIYHALVRQQGAGQPESLVSALLVLQQHCEHDIRHTKQSSLGNEICIGHNDEGGKDKGRGYDLDGGVGAGQRGDSVGTIEIDDEGEGERTQFAQEEYPELVSMRIHDGLKEMMWVSRSSGW